MKLSPEMKRVLEIMEKGASVSIYRPPGQVFATESAYWGDLGNENKAPNTNTVKSLQARGLIERTYDQATITQAGRDALKETKQ